jgi:GT2 family glycosyltransferase
VIDNASPDGGGRILEEKLSRKEFLQIPKNLGYAGGNNVGIRIALEADAEYVFIVNPDIRISPESIAAYIDVMTSDSSIGAINPIQLSPDGLSIDARFKWTIWGNTQPTESALLNAGQRWGAQTLLGAAIFLSSKAIKKIGLFDPLYFAYGEEQDLCRRILYHNFKLVVTSDSPVVHLRTHENTGSDDWRLFLRLKGIYLYKLKDPNTSFSSSLRNTLKLFFKDFRSKTPPYAHPFSKSHYLRVLFWLIRNAYFVYRHIQLERRGKAYV